MYCEYCGDEQDREAMYHNVITSVNICINCFEELFDIEKEEYE